MLLVIGLMLQSCESFKPVQIEVHRVPVLAVPVLPPRPTLNPSLVDQLQKPIGLTRKEVQYYQDICDRYESGEDPEALQEDSGLSRGAACDWVVFGQTIQGNFNLEAVLNTIGGHVEALHGQIDFLEQTIRNMIEVTNKASSQVP